MSGRRTLALGAFVAVGAALVALVRAPERRTGLDAVRGHRVFRVRAGAVQGVDLRLGERRLSARRRPPGWEVDGRPASPRLVEAIDDLLENAGRLRAVDVFRPRDGATFGLERPRAVIAVHTTRRRRRVVLGDANASGSAVYARRDDDPRVLQIGIMLLSGIERVFWARDGQPARSLTSGHAPETG